MAELPSFHITHHEHDSEQLPSRTCVVCRKEDARVICLPCGHMIYCPTCMEGQPKCRICDKRIVGSVLALFGTA